MRIIRIFWGFQFQKKREPKHSYRGIAFPISVQRGKIKRIGNRNCSIEEFRNLKTFSLYWDGCCLYTELFYGRVEKRTLNR